ncbi:MAG: hypothetical protein IR153_00025 [Flavobacterium sp.]|nr:hypothetical protein [Flavobacterium sp.]
MNYNKGFGFQALCEKCNKQLGSKYVPDFTQFINDFKNINGVGQQEYRINTKPLNVIKSIYANSIVINHNNQNIPEDFRNYVLNETYSHQFLNYRVFITNTKSEIFRHEGWRMQIDIPEKPVEIIASIEFPGIKISVINSVDITLARGLEITNFNNYPYNEENEIKIQYSR